MNRLKYLLRNINYLSKHSLWDQRENDIVYLTNKILDDAIYEYDFTPNNYRKINILSKKESMRLILDQRKSFVRTGDGECKIIMGLNQPFQKYNVEIAEGLIRILRNENDNLLVGINGNYYTSLYSMGNPYFYRRYGYDLRQVYEKYIDPEKVYIHAAITGYQFGKEKSVECIEQYELWREAFRDQNIIIVCGEGILDKLEYDVFELASSKQFIYGPRKNAWDVHEELIKKIKEKATKNDIIIFILGMAGKVMILELTELGYTCWDVGHLAKFYNAFRKELPMTPGDRERFYAPD